VNLFSIYFSPAIHPFNHSKHFLKRQGHHNYDPAFFLAIINSIILLVRYHFQLPYKSNAYVVICPISLEKLTGINEHIGSVYLCIIFLTVEQERPFVCNMYQDTQNVSNIALFAPFYEKIEHH